MVVFQGDFFYCVEKNTGNENNTENAINSLFHKFIFATNEEQKGVDCNRHIGFSERDYSSVIFFLLSMGGLILNIIVLYRSKSNSKGSRKESSMKKLFSIITFLDCLISIYWMISSSFFVKALWIKKHRSICTIVSMIYITLFTFEFIFINIILFHFRKLSLNPIEGILKPEKIYYYILFFLYVQE